jgi:hypothetical protein
MERLASQRVRSLANISMRDPAFSFLASRISTVLRTAKPAQTATSSTSYLGSRKHAVIFKHPGYADQFGQNVLLKAESEGRRGFLHEQARRFTRIAGPPNGAG